MTFDQVLQILGTVKWPGALVICLVIVVGILRADFGAWIRTWRGWRLWKARVDAEGPKDQAAGASLPLPALAEAPENAGAPQPPPIAPAAAIPLTSTATKFRQMISDAASHYAGADRVELIERIGAVATSVLVFERANFLIYGSQLEALQTLNSSGPVPTEQLRPLFDRAKADYPVAHEKSTFERWLSFLENFELTRREDDLVDITATGRDFLKHLIDQGYQLKRSL